METLEKGVEILTVKSLLPLYRKNNEEASFVSLMQFEELDYEVVVEKNAYRVGEKVVYISPDYCVPDTSLFYTFMYPGGEASKSKLGRLPNSDIKCRIKAIKFNMSKTLGVDRQDVFSEGIVFSIGYVAEKISVSILKILECEDLESLLSIYKVSEDIKNNDVKGVSSMTSFPFGVYKTGENNIKKYSVENLYFPCNFRGEVKLDGSSITIGITPSYPEGFICSRNMNIPFYKTVITGSKKPTLWTKFLGLFKTIDYNIYEEVENNNEYIIYGKPLLNKLKENNIKNLILRGELHGGNMKGSGNKNNPSLSLKTQVTLYNIDMMETQRDNSIKAVKINYDSFVNWCTILNIPYVINYFTKTFNNKEEIVNTCKEIFKKEGIEGIVVKTDSNVISMKVMNQEYDSTN